MNKKLLALLPLLAAAGVSSASPLPGAAQVRATNTLVADYVNTLKFPCPKHHNNCPESCGKAHEAVVLRVTKNEGYSKFGMYGDRKLDEGDTVMIDTHKAIPGQNDADIHAKISKLQTGDTVRLTIKHYYMDVRGIQSSSRAVTYLQVISSVPEEGDAAPKKAADAEEASSDDAEETTTEEEPSVDDSSSDDSSSDDTPAADETPADDTPAADETPADDTPAADETPADDTPSADETPADDTPAADDSSDEDPAPAADSDDDASMDIDIDL